MFYKRQLKKIMQLSMHDREVPLRRLAKKMGVSLFHSYSSSGVHNEPEMLKRIHEKLSLNNSSLAIKLSILSLIIAITAIILNLMQAKG